MTTETRERPEALLPHLAPAYRVLQMLMQHSRWIESQGNDTTRLSSMDSMQAQLRSMTSLSSTIAPMAHALPAQIIWRKGSLHVRYYPAYHGEAQLAVFIPSPFNSPDIFDLSPECSMVHRMRERGVGCVMLHWGAPSASEQTMRAEDYIAARIAPLLCFLRWHFQRPIALIGYCLGGVLALGAASWCQRYYPHAAPHSIVALATPFHFDPSPSITARNEWNDVDSWHQYFYMLFPSKLHQLLEQGLDAAPLHRWLGALTPLSHGFFRQITEEWVPHNALLQKRLPFGSFPLLASIGDIPLLLLNGTDDHIIAPHHSVGLLDLSSHSRQHCYPTGHIGIVISQVARCHGWEQIHRWITQIERRSAPS